MKKILIFLLLLLGTASPVFAVDLTVNCDGVGPCSMSPTNGAALFYEEKMLPGEKVARTVTVANNSNEDICNLYLDTKNESQTPANFSEKLLTIIKDPGTIFFDNKLKDLYVAGPISLGTVGKGNSKVLSWEIIFDPLTGNDYQGAITKFDFDLNFSCGVLPTPTNTPVPTSTPVPSNPSGPTSTPVPCSDSKPNTPSSLSAVTGLGVGQVTLSWTAPSGSYTSFLVAYSDNDTTPKWGNPNVGSGTSYVVGGLGTGTYYFWVRAQNNCMPGDFTGPISNTIITPGAGGVAAGFAEGVLGEQITITPTPSEIITPEVKGATEKAGVCTQCLWLPFLLLDLLGLLLYHFVFLKRKNLALKQTVIIGVLIQIIIYIFFWFFNRDRCWSWYCRLFWLMETILFLFFAFVWKKTKQDEENI